MTQKPCSVFGVYSRNLDADPSRVAKNASLENFNTGKSIESLQQLKRLTGGDTGSSNFEESKALNDSDSETEIVYLDLSSPQKNVDNKRQSERVTKRIFTLYNQSDVNSSQIMKYLKTEVTTLDQFKKLLKLKDQNNNNWTVLHYAAKLGHVSVLNYIISHYKKVDLNTLTKQGKTPLHLAIEMLQLSMIKFLIHNGASLHVRDGRGKSPYDLLYQYNIGYLVEKFLSRTSSEQTSDSQIKGTNNGSSSLPSTISTSEDKSKKHQSRDTSG